MTFSIKTHIHPLKRVITVIEPHSPAGCRPTAISPPVAREPGAATRQLKLRAWQPGRLDLPSWFSSKELSIFSESVQSSQYQVSVVRVHVIKDVHVHHGVCLSVLTCCMDCPCSQPYGWEEFLISQNMWHYFCIILTVCYLVNDVLCNLRCQKQWENIYLLLNIHFLVWKENV